MSYLKYILEKKEIISTYTEKFRRVTTWGDEKNTE